MEPRGQFATILRERSPDYHRMLTDVRRIGFENWIHLLLPDKGSHTGLAHLQGVERNADKMVPDEIKAQFTPAEIFLLLTAVFLHDIGKIKALGPKHAEER